MLEHDEWLTAGVFGVAVYGPHHQHLGHVGVAQARSDGSFTPKPRRSALVLQQLVVQDLQRNCPLEAKLLREVDARHGADTDQPLDSELSRDDTTQVGVTSDVFVLGAGGRAVFRAEQNGGAVALSTAYAAAGLPALTR